MFANNQQLFNKASMRSKSSSKEINTISNFIDSLMSPPSLHNPLRKSSSHKNINDSLTISKQIANQEQRVYQPKPSPIKLKSKSEDKAFQLYNNSKSYGQSISMENSMMLSHISEVTEGPIVIAQSKGVRFRQNIIMKNGHNRKDIARKESRTPSILKRSRLMRNNSFQFLQSNMNMSTLDRQNSIMNDDRESRALKTNEVVRKRYFTILQRFQAKLSMKIKKNLKIRSDQKYKDQLFPPIMSSIYRGGAIKNQQQKPEQIRWIRIPDFFKERKLLIFRDNQRSNLDIFCNKANICHNFIGQTFNSIKNNNDILQKMFEMRELNSFGVYLIKIFQQNVWKYVIIDDYIPVKDVNGEYIPLYLNFTELSRYKHDDIEIWPFLLEKAYANYYSNYESLHYGNTLDYIQQITGTSAQVFNFSNNQKKQQQNHKKLNRLFQREGTILLGCVEQDLTYVPILRSNKGVLTSTFFDIKQAQINIDNVYDYFDKIYVFNPKKWIHKAVSSIGINIKKTNQIPRFDISVRTLKVTEPGQISISIRQKQKRFYQNSSLNYNYIWIRCILLQKQFDGDCRWIDAKYSNHKSLNFFNVLEPGQYYVILLPQWKSSHCYQLSLIVNSTVPITLTKKDYDDKQALIEKGCADLAQRVGKLHQINLFACSYSFIHQQIGILIENINNQRYNGDIRINRSINGLKATVDLIPFNIEFYQQKNSKLPFKPQISVYISTDKSYTVILIMRGGIDLTFLKRFDFGK